VIFTQRDFLSSAQCDELLRFYDANYTDTFRLEWGHESRYQRLLDIQDPSVRQFIQSTILELHPSICADLGFDHFTPHFMEMFISNYQTGEGVGWHKDRPAFEYERPFVNERVYNFSINLNADYQGGSVHVDDLIVPKRLGIGTFFSVKNIHKVEPIQSGNRFSLIGWVYKKAGP